MALEDQCRPVPDSLEMANLSAADGSHGDVVFVLAGTHLSPKQAGQLEAQVQANPDDLASRLQLLGYYSTKQFGSKKALLARLRHVLWMIQNRPRDVVTGSPWCCSFPGHGHEACREQTIACWQTVLKSNQGDAVVLANAARYFRRDQEKIAESLLLQAHDSDPSNPVWLEELSSLYELQRIGATPKEKSELARKALARREQAFSLRQNGKEKFLRLDKLAWLAFQARDLLKASKFAQTIVNVSGDLPSERYRDQSAHEAHIVLGLIRLESGDIKGAEEHLSKASQEMQQNGRPTVTPDMTLAKELLRRHRRQSVLRFLKCCSEFGDPLRGSTRGLYRKWYLSVKQGRTPRFKDRLIPYFRS